MAFPENSPSINQNPRLFMTRLSFSRRASRYRQSKKVADYYSRIGAYEVACSSFPCRPTLSLYNAFMLTVSLKAAQSELNESDGRPPRTAYVRTSDRRPRRTTSRYLLKFIYRYCDIIPLSPLLSKVLLARQSILLNVVMTSNM